MKYIFTESQVKKIIDNQLNEQQTFGNYEGVIKTINGKTMVITTSEMGTTKQFPVRLKVKVADGTPVSVEYKNGVATIWGGKPVQKLN